MKLNKLIKREINLFAFKDLTTMDLKYFARKTLSQAFKEVIPKKRIMNKDNPQYVLGWNAYFYQLKKNIKDYLK